MQSNNNMHAILINSILDNLPQPLLLIARIQLRPRDIDPSCISGRNTQQIHSHRGKLVDMCFGDESGISFFEDRTTLSTQAFAEVPFVTGVAVFEPPGLIHGSGRFSGWRRAKRSQTTYCSCSSHPPRFTPLALNVRQPIHEEEELVMLVAALDAASRETTLATNLIARIDMLMRV